LSLLVTAILSAAFINTPAILYDEPFRPQFHFSAKQNWLNDPNGLVYYKGEYHLFFQHNPSGLGWGNMSWGHAVSPDLVHWNELSLAMVPDDLGTIFSGSAAIDWDNTSGFKSGKEKVMVAAYTAAEVVKVPNHYLQCIAYSNDKGRTWTKYTGNPVALKVVGGDPRIFWYEPERKWIMAVTHWVDGAEGVGLFTSRNLKDWTFMSHTPGFHECPDIFPLPLDGNKKTIKWVLLGGSGDYMVGAFDGHTFTPETAKIKADYGANYYATQTYNDIPARDGRRIQIVWMAGGQYPDMPFNQQMTFPCELTLKSTSEGPRVCRMPVNEIRNIYAKNHKWRNMDIIPGNNLLAGIQGDLFDISAEIDLGNASEVGIKIRGSDASFSTKDQKITCLGKSADLKPINNRIKLRILVDRSSIELFANDGRVSMSSCFVPDPANRNLDLYTTGGTAKVIAINIHELKSIWKK